MEREWNLLHCLGLRCGLGLEVRFSALRKMETQPLYNDVIFVLLSISGEYMGTPEMT